MRSIVVGFAIALFAASLVILAAFAATSAPAEAICSRPCSGCVHRMRGPSSWTVGRCASERRAMPSPPG